MAVSTATILAGTTTFIFDVTATADADTVTASVPHGLGAIPLDFTLTMLVDVPTLWKVTTADATNIILTKDTGAGSGDAAAQVRCTVHLPHTIVR